MIPKRTDVLLIFFDRYGDIAWTTIAEDERSALAEADHLSAAVPELVNVKLFSIHANGVTFLREEALPRGSESRR